MGTLKVKLCVSEERYAEISEYLSNIGIEISDDADFILSECNRYAEFIDGRRDDTLYRIRTDKIVFIESFGKNVILHTAEGEYNISWRLKELESSLNPQDFVRISNSVIIARNSIKKIQPTFGMKFILTLRDGSVVDVTRSYYYIFREKFGI